MPEPQTFAGASARLYVDTRAAMAQLQALQAYARQTRASMGGLPTAPTSSMTQSPLIAVAPSGAIPGSSANITRARMSVDAGRATIGSEAAKVGVIESFEQRKAASRAMAADKAARAASKKAASAFANPNFTLSDVTASGAAELTAGQQQLANLTKKVQKGVGIGVTGAHVGPYQVSSHGIGLIHAFGQTVGPYAGYLAIGYLGVKTSGAIGRAAMDAVAEAAEQGKTLNEYLFDEGAWNLAVKGGKKASAAAYELFDAASSEIRDGIGGVGSILLGETKNKRLLSNWALKVQQSHEDVSDFVAKLRGEKTSGQRRAEADDQRRVATEIAIASAQRKAEELGKSAAEQLLGMGFPGSLSDLRNEATTAYRTRLLELEAERLKQQRRDDSNNGKRG